MTFMARTQRARFSSRLRRRSRNRPPSAAAARDAGQLRQPVQILERRGEALEIAGLQKRAQAQLDARRFANGFVPLAALAQIGGDFVGWRRIP